MTTALLLVLLAAEWPPRDFASRLPSHNENASATRLMETVAEFGDDLRNSRPTPEFLDKHANTIRTLRAQIVSDPPPVWASDPRDILEPPMPPVSAHRWLFQIFGADAIAQHRRGNDAAAWADLHAIQVLTRALWNRPEPWSIGTAAFGNRMMTTVAASLDSAPPAWWAEAAAFDVRPALVRAIEYEAWAIRERANKYPAGESDGSFLDDTLRDTAAAILRPFRLVQSNVTIEHLHELADAVAKAGPCDRVRVASAPEWNGFIQRVMASQLRKEPCELDRKATK